MDSAAWRGFPFDWYPPAPVLVFPFPPMLAALKHSSSVLLELTLEPVRIAGLGTIDVVGKVEGADALLDTIRAISRRRSD